MVQEKGISQREYGRLLGVSGEAVRKAIKNSHIIKGWDKEKQLIYPTIANKEWGKKFEKDVTVTDIQMPQGNATPQNSNHISISSTDDFPEARRKKEILSAKIMALDLAERQGVLVQKEAVYKELYAKGQEIRSELLTIADRNIDNILAAKNRSEASNILTDAILAVLENFSKLVNTK